MGFSLLLDVSIESPCTVGIFLKDREPGVVGRLLILEAVEYACWEC